MSSQPWCGWPNGVVRLQINNYGRQLGRTRYCRIWSQQAINCSSQICKRRSNTMSSQQCHGWPNAVSYCHIWSLHTVAKCDFVLINVVDDRTHYCRIWSLHTASDCYFFSMYHSLLFLSNLGRTAAECELFSRTNQPEINCNSRLFYYNCCRQTRTVPVRHIYINIEVR